MGTSPVKTPEHPRKKESPGGKAWKFLNPERVWNMPLHHHSQPGLVSEASRNQEIISLLLFIPCSNQQPTACTVEGSHPRAVGVL